MKFAELFNNMKTSPGNYGVLDPMAVEIIKRKKIKTCVINGTNKENLIKAIKGEHMGTIISD